MIRPATRPHQCRRSGIRLTRHVQTLIANLQRPVASERRLCDRVAVPFLLQVTPLDADGEPLTREAVTVVGKDISSQGLSFFHGRALPFRRAIITMEHPQLAQLTVEVEMCWCRFSKLGWYESGGRLMRAVETQQLRLADGLSQQTSMPDLSMPVAT